MFHRYLTRAASARGGIYGLDPQEAFYPKSFQDGAGDDLDGGKNSYSLTFTPDSIPKALGFWSLTLYESDGQFYDNPINRYSISDHSNDLYYDDGVLTLYIQHNEPQDTLKARNWLPAPCSHFHLLTRLYWPTQDEIDSPYLPPGIMKSQSGTNMLPSSSSML